MEDSFIKLTQGCPVVLCQFIPQINLWVFLARSYNYANRDKMQPTKIQIEAKTSCLLWKFKMKILIIGLILILISVFYRISDLIWVLLILGFILLIIGIVIWSDS